MSLRRAQFRKAEEGNVTMLIWLGRNYLGQREEYKVTSNYEPEARTLLKQWDDQALVEKAHQQKSKKDDNREES